MTSEVSICNQALSLLGAGPITSLDDDTTEAKLCKMNYVPLRDTVLQEHNWSFATKWETLAQLADPPLGEYPNAFVLPPETLIVLFVGQDYNRQAERWQVEGGMIRTDLTTCKAQLLVQVTDVTRYSPMFVQALVARIAAELATPITESRTLMQSMFTLYDRKVKQAAARDTQQGRTRHMRSGWLSRARYRDGGNWAGPTV